MKLPGLMLGLLSLLAPLTSSVAADADALRLADAWVREAPPNARSLAAYLSLHNEGEKTVEIVAVHAAGFRQAMMHETVIEDGIARMRHLHTAEITAGSRLVFAPGGRHLMLMGPQRVLRVGDTVRICLEAADGSLLEFDYPVRRAR